VVLRKFLIICRNFAVRKHLVENKRLFPVAAVMEKGFVVKREQG
jgi:hypothetical protein